MNRTKMTIVVAACLSLTACVSAGRYDEAMKGADQARAEAALQARTDSTHITELKRSVSELRIGSASMQKDLAAAAEVDARLSSEVDKLGGDSRLLQADNGQLAAALDASRARLEELQRAQAAAEDRAAVYRDLALKLKGMVDAGDLAITLRDGRMVLRMPNDVLFDSGQAQLKPAGKRALAELAGVLRTIPTRRFQVAGHTDNEPTRLSPFKTNWELSTSRALEVVSFLLGKSVEPRDLSAAGYGEYDAVDTNDTREGRSRNRRTELTLQPNIDELVNVPHTGEGN